MPCRAEKNLQAEPSLPTELQEIMSLFLSAIFGYGSFGGDSFYSNRQLKQADMEIPMFLTPSIAYSLPGNPGWSCSCSMCQGHLLGPEQKTQVRKRETPQIKARP